MSHNGAFLGKSLHMSGFLAEETLWNEQGEIGVHVAGILEHLIKLVAHFLPQAKSIGLDHHAAFYVRMVRQTALDHQVIVPLRIILLTARNFFTHKMGS